MYIKNFSKLLLAAAILLGMSSCEKDLKDYTPPEVAHFIATAATASIFVLEEPAPGPIFKIAVGTSSVSLVDRKVKLVYEGTAERGVNYTAPDEITIPAGKAQDTVVIQTIFNGFPQNVTRTVKVKIGTQEGYIGKNGLLDSFTLSLQRPCDVDIQSFAGDYDNTSEVFGTGSVYNYTSPAVISSIEETGPTSARIGVENLWDSGWNTIFFDLDWANPASYVALVVPASSGIADAGTLGASYAGEEVAVRAFAGNAGTFSSCNGSLTLRMQLGVAGLGWFGDLYTVTMKR